MVRLWLVRTSRILVRSSNLLILLFYMNILTFITFFLTTSNLYMVRNLIIEYQVLEYLKTFHSTVSNLFLSTID